MSHGKKEKFHKKYGYQWERSNVIVLSWLMNSVAQNLISGWLMLQVYTQFGKIFMKDLIKSMDPTPSMFTEILQL